MEPKLFIWENIRLDRGKFAFAVIATEVKEARTRIVLQAEKKKMKRTDRSRLFRQLENRKYKEQEADVHLMIRRGP